MESEILSFDGEFAFLSNFSPSLLEYEGLTYPTLEHAFQAAKSLDPARRIEIAELPTPGLAKRAGRKVACRSDWDAVRVEVMRELLRIKFAPGSPLAAQLLATGDRRLVEGNWWNDRFWGVCRGVGRNMLGELLMQIRADLARPAGGSAAVIAPIPWDKTGFMPLHKIRCVSGTVTQDDLDAIADQLENGMLMDDRCHAPMERFWRIAKYVLLIAGADVDGQTLYEQGGGTQRESALRNLASSVPF